MGEIKTVNERDKLLDYELREEILSLSDFQETGEVIEQSDNFSTRVVRYKKNNQLFKLKSIYKPLSENSIALLESLELTKCLVHTQINRVYQKFEDAGAIHYLVEYVPNHSLYLEIILKESISSDEALNYLGQIHTVMDFLQTQNMFLKSLNPESIFIRENKQIVFTESVLVYEVSSYTPPEGWGSKEANLWAIGLLMFEITQGYSPFNKAISKDSSPFELDFDQRTSHHIKDFVLRSLKINPEERIIPKTETSLIGRNKERAKECSFKGDDVQMFLKPIILKESPEGKVKIKRILKKRKTIDRLERYLNGHKSRINKSFTKSEVIVDSIDFRTTKNTEEVILRKEHSFNVKFDDNDLVSILDEYETKQRYAENKNTSVGMLGWINKLFK